MPKSSPSPLLPLGFDLILPFLSLYKSLCPVFLFPFNLCTSCPFLSNFSISPGEGTALSHSRHSAQPSDCWGTTSSTILAHLTPILRFVFCASCENKNQKPFIPFKMAHSLSQTPYKLLNFRHLIQNPLICTVTPLSQPPLLVGSRSDFQIDYTS